VGIGTTSPNAKLGITNATDTQPILTASDYQGNEQMRLTNSGNVGIGTTTPGSTLGVAGDAEIASGNKLITNTQADDEKLIEFNASNKQFSFRQVTSGSAPDLAVYSGNTQLMQFGDNSKIGFNKQSRVDVNDTKAFHVQRQNNGDEVFVADTVNRQVTVPNGQMGIGTTTPNTKFVVGDSTATSTFAGDVRVKGTLDSSDIAFNNLSGNRIFTLTEGDRVGEDSGDLVYQNQNRDNRYIFGQNGELSLGSLAAENGTTSTFAGGLEVGGATTFTDNTKVSGDLSVESLATSTFAGSLDVAGGGQFAAGGAFGGNLQAGSLQSDTLNLDNNFSIANANTASSTENRLDITASSTQALSVLAGGNVGLGTTTAAQALNVAGTVAQTGATECNLRANASGEIMCQTSDRDLKTDIADLEDALDKVTELEGKTYTFKKPDKFGRGKQLGFIAQDVEGVFPQLVSDTGDYKSLDYANMSAALAEAVKELDIKVEDNRIFAGSSSSSETNVNDGNESSVTDRFVSAVKTALKEISDAGEVAFNKLITDTMVVRNDIQAEDVQANGTVSAGEEICLDGTCIDKQAFKAMAEDYQDQTSASVPESDPEDGTDDEPESSDDGTDDEDESAEDTEGSQDDNAASSSTASTTESQKQDSDNSQEEQTEGENDGDTNEANQKDSQPDKGENSNEQPNEKSEEDEQGADEDEPKNDNTEDNEKKDSEESDDPVTADESDESDSTSNGAGDGSDGDKKSDESKEGQEADAGDKQPENGDSSNEETGNDENDTEDDSQDDG